MVAGGVGGGADAFDPRDLWCPLCCSGGQVAGKTPAPQALCSEGWTGGRQTSGCEERVGAEPRVVEKPVLGTKVKERILKAGGE